MGAPKLGGGGVWGSPKLGLWGGFGVFGVPKIGILGQIWGFGVFWGFGVPKTGGSVGIWGFLGAWRNSGRRRTGALSPGFFHYASNRKCLDRKRRLHRKQEAERSGADGSECGAGNVGRRTRSCGAEGAAPKERGGGGAAPRLWGGDLWGRDLWGCPTSVGQFRIYGAVICGAVPSLSGVVLWGSPTATGQASMG